MNRMSASVACGLIATAIALGACGEDESQAYVDEVEAIYADLAAESDEALDPGLATDPEAFEQVSRRLQDIYERSANQLEAVSPPSEIAEEHDQLVELVRNHSTQLRAAEQGVAARDASRAGDAAKELDAVDRETQAIIDEINAKLE